MSPHNPRCILLPAWVLFSPLHGVTELLSPKPKGRLWLGFTLNSGSFPGALDGKESACKVGDQGLIPGSGRFHGKGNCNPFQYSCLGNPMDSGAWRATAHGVVKSQTWLSDQHFQHYIEEFDPEVIMTSLLSNDITVICTRLICLKNNLMTVANQSAFLSEYRVCYGIPLAIQWLKLLASRAGAEGLIPGQGTKILHAVWRPKKQRVCSILNDQACGLWGSNPASTTTTTTPLAVWWLGVAI